MIHNIKEHIAEVEAFSAKSLEEVEQFRIKYIGKKGLLNDFFTEFKNVPNRSKKRIWTDYQSSKNKSTLKKLAHKKRCYQKGKKSMEIMEI